MPRDVKDVLSRLQDWYASQCTPDPFDNFCPIKIGTIDNPGWSLEIDLVNIALVNDSFSEVRSPDYETNDSDWYICRVVDHKFDAACSPHRLSDVIEIFLTWSAG